VHCRANVPRLQRCRAGYPLTTIIRPIKTPFDYTEHRSGSPAGLVVALSHHDNFISTNRLRAHHFVYAMNERKEVTQSREAGGYGWYSLSNFSFR